MMNPLNDIVDCFQVERQLESAQHGDIVVEDFIDSHENLTLKTLFMLKWTFKHCNQFSYWVKTSDDVLLNTKGILKHLEHFGVEKKPMIIGYRKENMLPERSRTSSYYMPLWLYESKEEVYLTGLVANDRLKMLIRHEARICDGRPVYSDHPCLYHHLFSARGFPPQDLRRIWKILSVAKFQGCDSTYARFLFRIFGCGDYRYDGDAAWNFRNINHFNIRAIVTGFFCLRIHLILDTLFYL
uniref:Hexosyltransferase n=1 Tax=Timema poppense TaxID=170557 RepID=A0A7R9DL25_TIMPO|nr:unnamed protein product [Timema poppensis]